MTSFVEGELGRLRKAEKQNEKSEEVKEREENLNQVLQQSEVLIKSLRTAHDIEASILELNGIPFYQIMLGLTMPDITRDGML